MANLGVGIDARSDRVAVRGSSGKEARLRKSVEGGRPAPPSRFGPSGRSDATGSPSATYLTPTGAASDALWRKQLARNKEHVFATNKAAECWPVDSPGALSVGDGVERPGHWKRGEVEKLQRQLWRADGEYTRRRILTAAGQEAEDHGRVEALIRVTVYGCKVRRRHSRPPGPLT